MAAPEEYHQQYENRPAVRNFVNMPTALNETPEITFHLSLGL
jgi:hypothetical protein